MSYGRRQYPGIKVLQTPTPELYRGFKMLQVSLLGDSEAESNSENDYVYRTLCSTPELSENIGSGVSVDLEGGVLAVFNP